MLYERPPKDVPTRDALLMQLRRPCCYLEQAMLLDALHHACGMPLAELALQTGMSAAQVAARMYLAGLDEGMRSRLMAAGAPEGVALTLVRLPDEVTRRRVARRILRDRLCIRDSALLVEAALRRMGTLPQETERPVRRGRVISLVRDRRFYINAIRDITGQMRSAGVRADMTERRTAGMLEVTVSMPLRRRRMERYQSM